MQKEALQLFVKACNRVEKMVQQDAFVRSKLSGDKLQVAIGTTAYRITKEVADVVTAMLADQLNPLKLSKNQTVAIFAKILVNGGLAAFRTRKGESVAPLVLAVDAGVPVPAPTPAVTPTPKPVPKVPRAPAVVTAKAASKPEVKAASDPAPSAMQPVVAQPTPAPAAIPAQALPVAPPARPAVPAPVGEALESEPDAEEETSSGSEKFPDGHDKFCASVVISHLLITIVQLSVLDDDPGCALRSKKVSELLTEYQGVAEARISRWPQLS